MPDRLPPSRAEIEGLAQYALGTIPRQLKRHLGRVVIRVEEFPDEETEAAMDLESPFDILGLYQGVALPHKSVSDPRPDHDMIFLYRRRLSPIRPGLAHLDGAARRCANRPTRRAGSGTARASH